MTNIRSQSAYKNSFWDWTRYNSCFAPTKIRISDLEGIVERHGLFLMIETKQPGIDPDEGQRILLERLAALPDFTVIIVWGVLNQPEKMLRIGRGKRIADGPRVPCNVDILWKFIRSWFLYADSRNGHEIDEKRQPPIPNWEPEPEPDWEPEWEPDTDLKDLPF